MSQPPTSNSIGSAARENFVPVEFTSESLEVVAFELHQQVIFKFRELLRAKSLESDSELPRGLEFTNSPNRYGDRTLVVDYEIEDLVIEYFRKTGHAFRVISEEHGEFDIGTSPTYTLIIDGVDGSSQALKTRGRDRSATLFAVYRGPDPKYEDYLFAQSITLAKEESTYAIRGLGNRQIQSSKMQILAAKQSNSTPQIESAKIIADKYWKTVREHFLVKLDRCEIPWNCFDVCAHHYLEVIYGHADFNLECTRKKNLEVAVFYPLLRESGGFILDQYGNDIGIRQYREFGWQIEDHHPLIACRSKELAGQLLHLLDRTSSEHDLTLAPSQATFKNWISKLKIKHPAFSSEPSFIFDWFRSIESLGSSFTHLCATEMRNSKFDICNLEYQGIGLLSARSPDRSPHSFSELDYQPKRLTNGYESRVDPINCALCKRIVAIYDDLDQNGDSATVISMGSFGFVIPNRYPALPGHSLWLPKDHDLARTTPSRSLIEGELDEVAKYCLQNNLIAVRNHPFDGMTVPNHDHFHLLPDWALGVTEDYFDGFFPHQGSNSPLIELVNTPFSTLVVNLEQQSELAATLLNRLERAGVVYTLLCYRNRLLITPRVADIKQQSPQIKMGGAIALHIFPLDEPNFLTNAERFIERTGKFDWQRYTT